MSQRAFVRGGLYDLVFQKWISERSSEELQPLDHDFYSKISKEIAKISDDRFDILQIHNAILQRLQQFYRELKELRWNKLLEAALRNREIEDNFLTSHEIEFFRGIKVASEWFLSKEMDERPLVLSKPGTMDLFGNKAGIIEKNGDVIEDLVKVVFLSPVPEFVGTDLKKYGPFRPGDVFEVPKTIVTYVLLPKNLAKINSS